MKAEKAARERLRHHRDALIRLKYLQQRTFIVGQTSIADMYSLPSQADLDTELPFVHVSFHEPARVTIVCLPKQMEQFEEWMRREVVLESK